MPNAGWLGRVCRTSHRSHARPVRTEVRRGQWMPRLSGGLANFILGSYERVLSLGGRSRRKRPYQHGRGVLRAGAACPAASQPAALAATATAAHHATVHWSVARRVSRWKLRPIVRRGRPYLRPRGTERADLQRAGRRRVCRRWAHVLVVSRQSLFLRAIQQRSRVG